MSSQLTSPLPLIAGAIFAGGQSRRMGQPKEGLRLWDHRPMIEHVAGALSFIGQPLIIVGNCLGYSLENNTRYRHLPDEQPGQGPVSALKTLLSTGLAEYYVIASCDQPRLEPELLQLLVSEIPQYPEHAIFFQAQDGSKLDPFPGLYPASMLPAVQQFIQDEHFSMRKLIQTQPVHWVDLPKDQKVCLTNCNTPAEVEALSRLVNSSSIDTKPQAVLT
jgi:molybdopterin-guanine dinucleotide biosynthesis protein A